MSNQPHAATLVGLEEGRKSVFGTTSEAPSKRTFAEWKARGFFPFVKIGKRVFVNPEEVHRALERRFRVQAKEV